MHKSPLKAGIVCPAPLEYEICRDGLRLAGEKRFTGRLVSSKIDSNLEIVAVFAGPGKIQCASAAQLIIDTYRPDVIIDVGSAGAISPDVSVFDVVCAEKAYEYDICPIAEFPQYADDLTTHTVLDALAEEGREIFTQFSSQIKNYLSLNLRTGNIVSGEKNIASRADRDMLYEAFLASACNWETSAVLKTARLSGVKALSFRVITDEAGKDMKEELKANWEKALVKLCSVLDDFFGKGWLSRLFGCSKAEFRN